MLGFHDPETLAPQMVHEEAAGCRVAFDNEYRQA
jgi:hypothetical protein